MTGFKPVFLHTKNDLFTSLITSITMTTLIQFQNITFVDKHKRLNKYGKLKRIGSYDLSVTYI